MYGTNMQNVREKYFTQCSLRVAKMHRQSYYYHFYQEYPFYNQPLLVLQLYFNFTDYTTALILHFLFTNCYWFMILLLSNFSWHWTAGNKCADIRYSFTLVSIYMQDFFKIKITNIKTSITFITFIWQSYHLITNNFVVRAIAAHSQSIVEISSFWFSALIAKDQEFTWLSSLSLALCN